MYFNKNTILPLLFVILAVWCWLSGDVTIVSLGLFYVFALYLILKAYNESLSTKQGVVAAVVFLILLFVCYFQSEYRFIPLSGSDGFAFDMSARSLAENCSSFFDVILSSEKNFYVRIIACCYYVFGVSTIMPHMLSLYSFIVAYIYIIKSLKLLDIDRNVSVTALYYFLFCPIEIVFSLSLLREMPMQMLAVVALYNLLLYDCTNSVFCLANTLVMTVMASMMHGAMIAVLLVIAFFVLKKGQVGLIGKIIMVVGFVGVLAYIFSTDIGSAMLSKFGTMDEAELIEQASGSRGRTVYINSSANSLGDVVMQFPYRIVMFAFAPFPWQVYDIGTAVAAVLTTVPQYIMFYAVWRAYFEKYMPDDKDLYNIIMLSVFALYLMGCYGTSNFGTAIRHRVKLYPFMVIAWAMVRNEYCLGKMRNEKIILPREEI